MRTRQETVVFLEKLDFFKFQKMNHLLMRKFLLNFKVFLII